MKLIDHLVYIDITNQCDINCDFCMYRKERKRNPKNLRLNSQARKNLNSLINDPETDHTIISGEGEPFCNEQTIWGVLNLSRGGNRFQIITNGSWIDQRGERIIQKLDDLAKSKRDVYTIRLSVDSYHTEKVARSNYSNFLQLASRKDGRFKNVRFAVRSLVEDKPFVEDFIKIILKQIGVDYVFREESALDQEVLFLESRLSINYKNLVNPDPSKMHGVFSIWDYMGSLEQKYNKSFTLGNLRTKRGKKGLDITFKPNGESFFYGAELEPHGNLFEDNLNIKHFKSRLESNPLLKALYTIPLSNVLRSLCKDQQLKDRIEKINNPYWIIKQLYPKYKNKFDSALNIK